MPGEVSKLRAPVPIHTGTADRVVPVDEVRDLEKVLRAQGTPVELFGYEGADHGLTAAGGDDSTVDPTRGHRRGDEARKETDSPNEDDLLPISELLREACARIEDRKRADAKGRPGADTVTARWRDRGRSFPAPDTRLQWPGRGPTALEVPQYWTGPPGLRVIGPP